MKDKDRLYLSLLGPAIGISALEIIFRQHALREAFALLPKYYLAAGGAALGSWITLSLLMFVIMFRDKGPGIVHGAQLIFSMLIAAVTAIIGITHYQIIWPALDALSITVGISWFLFWAAIPIADFYRYYPEIFEPIFMKDHVWEIIRWT